MKANEEVIDPAEITAIPANHPTREQTEKSLWEKQPGHIAWSVGTAHHAGCRVLTFLDTGASGLTAEDAQCFSEELSGKQRPSTAAGFMNAYFSTRANLVVVNMWADCGSLHVVVTTQVDERDLDILQEIQLLNTQMYAEARKRIEDRQAVRAEQVRAMEREQKRLAEIGKRAEDHNLAGRVKELEAENAALRKLNKGES